MRPGIRNMPKPVPSSSGSLQVLADQTQQPDLAPSRSRNSCVGDLERAALHGVEHLAALFALIQHREERADAAAAGHTGRRRTSAACCHRALGELPVGFGILAAETLAMPRRSGRDPCRRRACSDRRRSWRTGVVVGTSGRSGRGARARPRGSCGLPWIMMCTLECSSCQYPGVLISRVTTPPPGQALRSSTNTFLPALAR